MLFIFNPFLKVHLVLSASEQDATYCVFPDSSLVKNHRRYILSLMMQLSVNPDLPSILMLVLPCCQLHVVSSVLILLRQRGNVDANIHSVHVAVIGNAICICFLIIIWWVNLKNSNRVCFWLLFFLILGCGSRALQISLLSVYLSQWSGCTKLLTCVKPLFSKSSKFSGTWHFVSSLCAWFLLIYCYCRGLCRL